MSLDSIHARTLIARMIDELSSRDRQIRDDLAGVRQPPAGGFADRATERQNEDVLKRIDEATCIELAQARHALERLDAGFYGVCEQCGYKIEAARMMHVPHATLCSDCAAVRH